MQQASVRVNASLQNAFFSGQNRSYQHLPAASPLASSPHSSVITAAPKFLRPYLVHLRYIDGTQVIDDVAAAAVQAHLVPSIQPDAPLHFRQLTLQEPRQSDRDHLMSKAWLLYGSASYKDVRSIKRNIPQYPLTTAYTLNYSRIP